MHHLTSQQVPEFETLVQNAQIGCPLVAVYCGSRAGADPLYVQEAHRLGVALGQNQLGLVYGGACVGMMGAVADGVLSEGGTAVGVIPTFLLDKEIAHPRLSKLYTTDTMHTRKALMAQFASAFVVLAGGLGTLEEMMEIATWRQLYQHEKPMILLNTKGFYDTLLAHLAHTIQEGFMSMVDLDRLVVCHSIEEVVKALANLVVTHENLAIEKF